MSRMYFSVSVWLIKSYTWVLLIPGSIELSISWGGCWSIFFSCCYKHTCSLNIWNVQPPDMSQVDMIAFIIIIIIVIIIIIIEIPHEYELTPKENIYTYIFYEPCTDVSFMWRKTHSSNMMVKLILHKLIQSCTNWLKTFVDNYARINEYIHKNIIYHQRQCHNKDNNKKR